MRALIIVLLVAGVSKRPGTPLPPDPTIFLVVPPNCWSANFVWKMPRVAVRVTALLSDGSERAWNDVFVLDAVKVWSEK